MEESLNNNNLLYLSIAFLGGIFALIGGLVYKLYSNEKQAQLRAEAVREMMDGEEEGEDRGLRRRRVQANHAADDDEDGPQIDLPEFNKGKKIGTKKLAKLEAKAAARAAREEMLIEREEQKQAEAEREAELEKVRLQEAEEEAVRAEEERRAREAKEKRELEEYLKMKAAFSVEEEGEDAKTEEEEQNLIENFLNFVRESKVVNVDELASRFRMDVETTVAKLKYFIEEETVTGVLDDRGKFIYISEEELAAVARFINQRGRISLSDLANYSNKLVSFESQIAA
uniref:DDRGK domain-containing protein 1 n=1 Tax=Panagrellus redivivus TaxID=6233 RepID=A0A7E4VLC9_PANRE